MNNEAPASTAALQARIADLEQQLKLSDEGVSRLAERCLGLEQEVQSYLAAHPQNEKHTDSPACRTVKPGIRLRMMTQLTRPSSTG